jgi:hypothetical protein
LNFVVEFLKNDHFPFLSTTEANRSERGLLLS